MHVFVVDGGPRGGKTSIEKAIAAEFGNKVRWVPETATALFGAGFPNPTELGMEHLEIFLNKFQPAVYHYQSNNEDLQVIRARQQGAKALVYDRGIAGQAAYIPGGWPKLEELAGQKESEILKRYHTAILLQSTAVFDPEGYERDVQKDNDKRYETSAEFAASLDQRTADAWQNHPNLHRIEGSRGVDYVVNLALDIIRSVFEIEDENKYLLSGMPNITLPVGRMIIQGYLPKELDSTRFRSIDGVEFFIAEKGEGTKRRRQWEQRIPGYIFEKKWRLTEGARVRKTRYAIPYGDFTLELDQYHDQCEGLVVLECEFDSPEHEANFRLPDWAHEMNAIDVTDRTEYKAESLARHGLPSLVVAY